MRPAQRNGERIAIAALALALAVVTGLGYVAISELRQNSATKNDVAGARSRSATRVDVEMIEARLRSIDVSLQRRALADRKIPVLAPSPASARRPVETRAIDDRLYQLEQSQLDTERKRTSDCLYRQRC